MKILKTREEVIIFHGNIAPHEDQLLAEAVVVPEGFLGLFTCRREESTGIHDDIIGLRIFRILDVLDGRTVRVLQNLPDSEFEVDEVFGTTEVDGGEAKGHEKELRIKNYEL
jgi:hypothetical protein